MWIGIDPGEKGGITCLNKFGMITHVFVMPKDISELAKFLGKHKDKIRLVVIEKSQSYPQQSVTATFNYGTSYGILQGILIAYEIDYLLIPPRTWQKEMILPSKHTDPKKKALASANRVFKKNNYFWLPSKRHRKPHDGLVDSALIAEYCRRIKQI